MSGRQAAVITLTANNNKQMDVVTFGKKSHGTLRAH
jgi:hypothetical protein